MLVDGRWGVDASGRFWDLKRCGCLGLVSSDDPALPGFGADRSAGANPDLRTADDALVPAGRGQVGSENASTTRSATAGQGYRTQDA